MMNGIKRMSSVVKEIIQLKISKEKQMHPLVVILVSLSLILCLLSITTNYWSERIEDEFNSGLFLKCVGISDRICSHIPYTHSRGLSISAFIFLLISFVTLIFSWFNSENRLFSYLTVLFLLISSLLLLFSFILYPKENQSHQIGHSSYLMLVSTLLTFVSTILTTFIAQTIQTTNF
jgi:hypothetical protein